MKNGKLGFSVVVLTLPLFYLLYWLLFVTWKGSSDEEDLEKVIVTENSICTKASRVVLFTVFKDGGFGDVRRNVNELVVKNWGQFHPTVQPVAFATNATLRDSNFRRILSANHWHVYPIPESNAAGTPKLKPMFKFILKRYQTVNTLGYVNGDVIFDSGLVDTIESVQCTFNVYNRSNFVLTGKRWNYDYFQRLVSNDNDDSFGYYEDVIWQSNFVFKLKSKASLSGEDIEDFFIADRSFPWDAVQDIVIGRPGYDNYLVYVAKLLGYLVVDTTETLTAVKLTSTSTAREGVTHSDAEYNIDLLGDVPYKEGYANRACFKTKPQEQQTRPSVYLTICQRRHCDFSAFKFSNVIKGSQQS